MQICGAAAGGRRLVHAAVVALTLLAPGGLAAAASAQTLSVDKPCYVNVNTKTGLTPAVMTVTGTGYAAGDSVYINSSDGSVNAQATADAAGNISVQTTAPNPVLNLPGAKTVTLTAQDPTLAGTMLSAATPVTATTLAVLPQPTQAKLTRKVTWYFSGFAPGKYIYGHYVRKNQVARARFGRAHGPCGVLKARARFYPGGHPKYGKYKLQFDDSKPYSEQSLPRYVLQITQTIL